MLKSLKLTNFQIHKSLEIELDPYITVLTGESDAGKSSVIRSLFLLCFNRPSGSNFILHGENSCKVKLVVDNSTVIRGRGEGSNYYSLNKKKLYAFGKGVPSEISNLLNVDETNFQNQHDAPFWFSLTPGEVSRELNRIVNLDLIDKTLSNLASELRKGKLLVSLCKDRLLEAREQRDSLAWSKEADKSLKKIEESEILISENRSRIDRLTSLIQDGASLVSIYSLAVDAILGLSPLVQRGIALLSLRGRIKKLRNLYELYHEATKIVKSTIPRSSIIPICDTSNRIEFIDREREKLESLIRRVKELEEEKWQSERLSTQARKELESLIGKKCPLCHQVIK